MNKAVAFAILLGTSAFMLFAGYIAGMQDNNNKMIVPKGVIAQVKNGNTCTLEIDRINTVTRESYMGWYC